MTVSDYDEVYLAGGFHYHASRPQHVAWLREHVIDALGLLDLNRRTLLDAGCGDGFWSAVFHDEGFEVTGIDQSLAGIDIARTKYPGPEFLLGDLNGLVRVDRQWNIVFARTLPGYFNSDDPERLPYLVRSLAPLAIDRLVFVVYTTRTGGLSDNARMHPTATLVKGVNAAGYAVDALFEVGNYVVMGISQEVDHGSG